MEQFAFTYVHPLRIAWLIPYNDWKHFEKLIYYNCAMLGGYFNVLIPLTEHDTISEDYQGFLTNYDPDFIVLTPGMTTDQLGSLSDRINPFKIIPWDLAATLGPQRGKNEIYGLADIPTIERRDRIAVAFVAVADTAFPDTSRLALVACGDVRPLFYDKDEEDNLRATGDREDFLVRLLIKGYGQESVTAQFEDDRWVPPPDRFQLSNLVSEKYKFPLSGALAILRTCFKLQALRDASTCQCFIGLTAAYYNDYWDRKNWDENDEKPIIILVSDSFSLEDAVLFWNLRATGRYVAWLSFSHLEKDLNAIAKWLDSGPEDVFIDWSRPCAVAFATKDEEISRLLVLVNLLQTMRITLPDQYGGHFEARMDVVKHENLVSSKYSPFEMRSDQVMIMKNESQYTFLPQLPQRDPFSRIAFTVTLKWNGCMFPPHNQIIQRANSSKMFQFDNSQREGEMLNISAPRFRISNEGYLKALTDSEHPLEFIRPSPEQAIQVIFESAGFACIEPSSTARYHTIFINRAGGLDQATYYLSTSPYRELLNLLADNKSKNKSGWLLENPAKRRVLHHLFLRKALGETTSSSLEEYFNTVSDELPVQAFHLLEKSPLERGFLLRCRTCSFHSWYPAEHIGQTFECIRCFQTQIYDSNPLWLYKLPEVIFQGFADNMQVPILALNYLKDQRDIQRPYDRKHYFEWVSDSNVYQQANDKKSLGNIDLLCFHNGRLYIGEAKSNDEIEESQFLFYEQICRRVPLGGIVFATSQSHWKQGTQRRIDSLKAWFGGTVLILTEKDLYRNKNIS